MTSYLYLLLNWKSPKLAYELDLVVGAFPLGAQDLEIALQLVRLCPDNGLVKGSAG